MPRLRGSSGAFGGEALGIAGSGSRGINPFVGSSPNSIVDDVSASYRSAQIVVGTDDKETRLRLRGNGLWLPYMSGVDYLEISLNNNNNFVRLREGMSILGVSFAEIWYKIPGTSTIRVDVVGFQDSFGNRVDVE